MEEKVEVEQDEEEDEVDEEQSENEPSFSVNPDTPVGHDYVRQVVMFYCDLCHKYWPKLNRGDPDELIDTHCVSTSHQDAYVKKQIEEQEALKTLAEEEQESLTTPKEQISFNEDQLDYEPEVNGD